MGNYECCNRPIEPTKSILEAIQIKKKRSNTTSQHKTNLQVPQLPLVSQGDEIILNTNNSITKVERRPLETIIQEESESDFSPSASITNHHTFRPNKHSFSPQMEGLQIDISYEHPNFPTNESVKPEPYLYDPTVSNPIVQKIKEVLGPLILIHSEEDFTEKVAQQAPYKYEDGSIYKGQWNENKRQGFGSQYWTDGSIYEGQWYDDKAHGYGRLIHSNGDVYEGFWKRDKTHGFGAYVNKNGVVFKGNWVYDNQQGLGSEEWKDGTYFRGHYFQGKKNGYGEFYWKDGSSYKGEFENNHISGKGIYVWKDGLKYEGEWKMDKMNGFGKFTWPDGKYYEGIGKVFIRGFYKNDLKDGYGEFYWPDRTAYKGYWRKGIQEGPGKFIGKVIEENKEGIWSDGQLVYEGKFEPNQISLK